MISLKKLVFGINPTQKVSNRSKRQNEKMMFLLLMFLCELCCIGVSGHLPSTQFKEFNVIHPVLYSPRLKRAVSSSHAPGEAGGHAHHLSMSYADPHSGREVWLDLQLNKELLPEGYFEKRHHKGKPVVNYPVADELEFCHYQGTVRGAPGSWAAISTCQGSLQGVVFDGVELHHIEKVENETESSSKHYLYSQQHLHQNLNRTCGHKSSQEHLLTGQYTKKSQSGQGKRSSDSKRSFNDRLNLKTRGSSLMDDVNSILDRTKRDISNSLPQDDQPAPHPNGPKLDIKGPWDANKRSRYVELVIVVDNRKFKENNEDLDKVYRKCKDIANIANALYAPLNIYIALVGVVVWSEYDEITLSTDADTTLTNFLHYRRERLVKEHPNDNAQLLTGIQFDQGVVGKALKGPMCTYEFSGGVSIWHSEVIGIVAVTMAHEMGHNFGMDHDGTNCKCPEQQCIMGPSSSTMKWYFWSSCSLEHLAMAFEHGMDYCLRNKPRTLFGSPVCGNGFVEPGEECDCGLREHCDNPCCNPETCRMYANATCATGKCCDLNTCKPKLPGEICRLAEHECDLPEFCTGKSEFCPSDIFKVDGIPCKVGQSFCYQGTCRTHSDQCRLLWGPSGKKSDNQCYEHNSRGTRHGNCGYNRLNDSYIPCTEQDVHCGMLHCSHLNERLEFGMESVAILSHSFINSGGRIIPCRTALVDLGLEEVDPGLAPEGAMCGPDSLCVNQKCMPVASLKVGPQSCPENCHGHGVCNSMGHCHCDVGWEPPYCMEPGSGGSIDSGPASRPTDDSVMSNVFYIIFFGILPILIIAFCLFYLNRGKLRLAKSHGSTGGEEGGFFKIERHRTSRPPSRLNLDAKDISGPVSLETGHSAASSPTHVLLPRSKTQVSEIGDPTSDSIPTAQSTSESKITGMFSSNIFGNLRGIRYKKPGSGSGAGDDTGSEFSENNTDSTSRKSQASRIFKSISSSIPSQLCKPIKKHSMDSSRYEVRIEPRLHQDSEHSPVEHLDPILSLHQHQSSPDSPDASKPKSPQATMTSPSKITEGKAKSCTLPASMSLVSVPAQASAQPGSDRKNSSPVVTMIETPAIPAPDVNNPKLAFPHSSSFSQPPATAILPPVAEKKIPESSSAGSIKNVNSNKEMWYRNPSSYLNRHASYRSATGGANKDLTFKKPDFAVETNFSTSSNKSTLPLSSSSTVNKSEPSSLSSSTGKPEVTAPKPVITAKPTVTVASKPPLANSPPSSSNTSTTLSTTSAKSTTCPSTTKPVTTLTLSPFTQNSATVADVKTTVADTKPVVKHSLWSVMDGDKPKSEEKPLGVQLPLVESTEKQKAPPEKSVTGKSAIKDKKADKSKVDEKDKSVKSPERESSLLGVESASDLSLASQASSGVASSIGGKEKPIISRPILQTATPTAASLIARAPSTGVSQSSILSGKEKESDPFKPPKERGRRAVFCDPITLPSPTSPNNPPIIHQPTGPQAPGPKEVPTSPPPDPARYSEAIITPIWSTQSAPAPCQVEECDLGGQSPTKQADKSTLSKLISNVKRTPSMSGQKKSKDETESLSRKTSRAGKIDRSSLRNLEISSPVLQSEVDTARLHLVPVSRSQEDSRLSPDRPQPPPVPQRGESNTNSLNKNTAPRQGSPSTKRQAPKPPPAKPLRSPDAINSKSVSSTTTQPASSSKIDDITIKSKPKYQPFSSSAQQRTSAQTASSIWESGSSSGTTTRPPKPSSSDDSLDSKKDANAPASLTRQRRPVSIATSKPNRPTAPPPKPPPSSRGSSGSASPDDSSMLLNTRTGVKSAGSVTAPLAKNEPIYDTITEESEAAGKDPSGDEFETPLGSPVFTKKSPDTLSTCSSGEEDLMKERIA